MGIIAPLEVDRALAKGGETWRDLMPQGRDVAQRLAGARCLNVTRGGWRGDATHGPIRLRRPESA